MAISKVVYGNRTLIDLTEDTVAADKLLSGYTAHTSAGVKVTGTASAGTDTSDATASASDILSTKTAYVNGSKVTGTMTNRGAVSQTIAPGGSYTIPQGYHNGSGKVSASAGLDTSDATAGAGDILSSKTAYVNGSKVTGTMTNRGAVTQTIAPGGSYTIPAGYHNGSGKVSASSGLDTSDANATAADILSTKTAYVNGSKVTGSMTNRGAVSQTIAPGGSYTIPAGYHNGSGKVYASSDSVWTSAYTVYSGDTSKTISNANIGTTSVIIPYGQTSSGKPIAFSKIAVSSGSATITFASALTEGGSIRLEIIN